MSEEKQIREILDGIQMPDSIAGTEFRLDLDHQGEPAARIRVIIKDEAWNDDWPYQYADGIRRSIRDAFQEAGLEHWPYIDFFTEQDIREFQSAGNVK